MFLHFLTHSHSSELRSLEWSAGCLPFTSEKDWTGKHNETVISLHESTSQMLSVPNNACPLFLEWLWLIKKKHFWWFLCIFLEMHSSNDQSLFITTDCTIISVKSGCTDVAEQHWLTVLSEPVASFDYFWATAVTRTAACPNTHVPYIPLHNVSRR